MRPPCVQRKSNYRLRQCIGPVTSYCGHCTTQNSTRWCPQTTSSVTVVVGFHVIPIMIDDKSYPAAHGFVWKQDDQTFPGLNMLKTSIFLPFWDHIFRPITGLKRRPLVTSGPTWGIFGLPLGCHELGLCCGKTTINLPSEDDTYHPSKVSNWPHLHWPLPPGYSQHRLLSRRCQKMLDTPEKTPTIMGKNDDLPLEFWCFPPYFFCSSQLLAKAVHQAERTRLAVLKFFQWYTLKPLHVHREKMKKHCMNEVLGYFIFRQTHIPKTWQTSRWPQSNVNMHTALLLVAWGT